MKTFVTFGQIHAHSIGGKTFDKDCVAVIEGPSAQANRAKVFEIFGKEWCFEFPENEWDDEKMRYFRRGYIEV